MSVMFQRFCFWCGGGGFGAPSSVGFSRDLRQCPLLTAPAPHCAFRSLIFFASAGHSGLGLALTSGDSIQQDSKQVPVCRPSVWPQSGGVTVYARCAIPTCVRSLILERARDLTLGSLNLGECCHERHDEDSSTLENSQRETRALLLSRSRGHLTLA